MKERWNVTEEYFVKLEDGITPNGDTSNGRSASSSDGWKQLIQCVKLILSLELLLLSGWVCYSMWQVYRIESMKVKATDNIYVSGSQESDGVLTRVDVPSLKGEVLSYSARNKFYNSETNSATNRTGDHFLKLNREHDLIRSTSEDKNCAHQSTESSVSFAKLVETGGVENVQGVGIEYGNSDAPETRKNTVPWSMRHKVVDYGNGTSSDYIETRRMSPLLRDKDVNYSSTKLGNTDENNYAPRSSKLRKIVKPSILEGSAMENIVEHQDGTVLTPAGVDLSQSAPVPKSQMKGDKVERKLSAINSKTIKGGINYKKRFKDTGKRGQAKMFLDINEDSRSKEIVSDFNIQNLAEDDQKRQAESTDWFKHKEMEGNGGTLKDFPSNFDTDLLNYEFSSAESTSVLSKSDAATKNIKGIHEVLTPIYVNDRRIRQREKRSNADVATVSEGLVSMYDKGMEDQEPVRLFKKKIAHDVDTFGRRTSWSIDRGAKTKGTRLDSLNEYRMSAFTLYNDIGDRENVSPRTSTVSADYHRKLNGNGLNNLFDRMETLAQHIDKLHERYLRYNELNDDYISKELPSEYFDE